MKFSFRQILASVGGAVIAAIIASTFGVKGTIIGVAIGSAAATIGTALVAQSIERGQQAVKQVVVRAPDSSSLLRKLGATGLSGGAASSVDASSAPTEAMATGGAAETVEMESNTVSDETGRLEISAVADAPATERLQATTTPMQPAVPGAGTGARRQFSWSAIAGTAAIVFVLALMLITAIELISGKPLASIFGNAGSGTSVGNVVTPPPPATTSTTTTTTSPPSSSSTTTTTTSTTSTSPSTTTSTTAPSGTSTTSTTPAASTTTTRVGSSSSTSTTVAGATSP